jgi:Flavin containing amine oxidoreductase
VGRQAEPAGQVTTHPVRRCQPRIYRYQRYTTGLDHGDRAGAAVAGEHTSLENQGFIEGAVESGERVAAEI